MYPELDGAQLQPTPTLALAATPIALAAAHLAFAFATAALTLTLAATPIALAGAAIVTTIIATIPFAAATLTFATRSCLFALTLATTAVALAAATLAITSSVTALAAALATVNVALAAAALAAMAKGSCVDAAASLHRRGDIGGFGRRERLHALGARLDRRLLRGGGQRLSLIRSSHSHIGLRTSGAEHRRRHARGCSDSRGGPRASSEQRRQCLGDAASEPLRHRHACGAAHRVVAVDAAGGASATTGIGIGTGRRHHRNYRGRRCDGARYGAAAGPSSWLVQARTSNRGCDAAQVRELA